MMEPSRAEEVRAELLRAETSLQAAQSLLQTIFWKMRFHGPTMPFSMQPAPCCFPKA